MELGRIISFLELVDRFRKVERIVHAPGEERWENDVEHSFGLAMLAWYIAESEKLDLDVSKLLKYALVHDLVETYAGDTYFYDAGEMRNTKKEREEAAAKRIREELPEFPELHELIHAYETREDKESQFIYALDKVHPMLQIYLGGGRTWRDKGVTLEMLVNNKTPKVSASPEVKAIFESFVMELKSKEQELFPSKSESLDLKA